MGRDGFVAFSLYRGADRDHFADYGFSRVHAAGDDRCDVMDLDLTGPPPLLLLRGLPHTRVTQCTSWRNAPISYPIFILVASHAPADERLLSSHACTGIPK